MNNSLTRNILRIGFISVGLLLFTLTSTNPLNAGQLIPSLSDQVIFYGQNLTGELRYTNTSQITEQLSVEIFSYDPRESEVIATGPILMSTKISELTVEPNQEVIIPYQVSAVTELAMGSYFNVVALIDSSEKEGYNSDKVGEGSVRFNLRKGEGALFAFHVTDGGEVLSAQDISVQSSSKRLWFLLPFFQADPEVTVTNNSAYPIKVTGELRVFTKSGKLLATTRIEDARLYPGEDFVDDAAPNYWGLEDIKLVYSFGNNLGADINTGVEQYKNYTYFLLIGLVASGVVAVAVVRFFKTRRKSLNAPKGIF